ncbi:MAG: carbohydrate ABC transporter permease [Clostridia bacterium]|nr:carbohydrate ABC transporter permease [Clostridia bacterium]
MKRTVFDFRRCLWPIFRTALLIGLGYIILYPIMYMISMSFRGVEDLYNPTVNWVPIHYTFDNFKRVVEGIDYFRVLTNTAILSVGVSVILLPACSLVAYSLARFHYRGRTIILAAVLLTIVVPMGFFTSAQFLNFSHFSMFGILDMVNAFSGKNFSINLIDSLASFFVPAALGIGVRSGLYIYILMQTFKGLPKELEEAAYIDGCGFIKTFTKIIIPSSVPSFVTVFLFSLVWHWNDYQLSSMFMPNHRTLASSIKSLGSILYGAIDPSVLIDSKQSVLDNQVACLLLIVPLLVIYLFTQRFFTDSIERTGLVE